MMRRQSVIPRLRDTEGIQCLINLIFRFFSSKRKKQHLSVYIFYTCLKLCGIFIGWTERNKIPILDSFKKPPPLRYAHPTVLQAEAL